MTTEKTWALIANGERAKIVTNLGDHQAQQVQVVGSRQLELDRQSTKNSNRRPALIGKSRFGTEPHTDPVRNRERLFIEKISEYCVIVAQSDIDLIHLDDMDLIQALLAILKGRRVKG